MDLHFSLTSPLDGKKSLTVIFEKKNRSVKNQSLNLGCQVTHWEGTIVSRSIPLNSYTYGFYYQI